MILLATDFGHGGSYTGEMMAVLHRTAPDIAAVTLIADLPPFEPRLAAYHLAALFLRTEPGDILVGVVDPGVGSDRLPLAIEVDGRWLVGPDNGLFELILRRADEWRCHAITWKPGDLSASFHGRDLFAPFAARLAGGERDHLEPCAPFRHPDWPDDLAAIVHTDVYGNLITGIRASHLPEGAHLKVDGRPVARARTFSDMPEGTLFFHENSAGLIEVAANRRSAAELTGMSPGSPFTVELQDASRTSI
ncbi:MAG: SAM-dependent chlorinase/fluorinase [Geminicoccaceae bacterium]